MRHLLLLLTAALLLGEIPADPYRWLEQTNSARTQQWIDAQNTRAEAAIDAYQGNAAVAKRVEALSLTGPEQFGPQLSGNTLFYMREVPPQPQPVLMARSWPNGMPHVVLDPARLGPAISIDFVWPSPSGKLLALATSSGGSEAATIRIVDVRGRRTFAEALGPAGGGTTGPVVAWDADEHGITYGRLPANGSQFGIKLYHHVLGTAQSTDALALGEISPIAEWQLLTTDDAKRAAGLVTFGDGAFSRVYVRRGSTWAAVLGPQSGIVAGHYVGNHLLLVATAGSPHGRIAELNASGQLRTIVPEARDWAYHDVVPMGGGFLVTKSWGMKWAVDHFDAAGHLIRTVPLPPSGIGIDGIASDSAQDTALIAYSGWTGPASRWVTYDGSTGTLHTVYDLRPPSNDYANVRVKEITGISRDGTRIPVTVLSMAGTPQNGTAPAILTGYGGFNIPSPPGFIGSMLAWLQMGGVYAVATLRGGNEFGEGWHQQGRLTNKQHVFDDFYAAAQALVKNGYTTPRRLGIEGGSNGGLLVGAALVQHPEQYGAVVGFAGIYDVLRHHLFPNGVYNASEYGNTADPAIFRAIYAYAPYDHVRKGFAYPAVLLVTSENDPRVAPWQSWKFGAALQAATSGQRPIVVLTHRTGGHGHGASFAQRVGNEAVMLSFMAAQLGVHANAVGQR